MGAGQVSSNNLQVGRRYTINVRVRNDTDFSAQGATVTVKWALWGVGQKVWQEIDTDSLDVPAHSSRVAEIEWTPPITGHVCIKAEIYHAEDINAGPEGNNEGQENTHVGPASSPAEVSFQVCNPTDEPAAVFLELRQIRQTVEEAETEELAQLWATWIRHPDPQVLQPGECREATAIIDPELAGIAPGQTAYFALTGFIGGRNVGGVNFEITAE